MKFVIDTHLLILLHVAPSRVPGPVAAWLRDETDEILGSTISIAEIAIKYAPSHAAMPDLVPPHHRDPFDRMLVAQAIADNPILVTRDAALSAYGAHVTVV